MKLTLEAGQIAPEIDLPLEVQSISSSGLVVLTADKAPPGLDRKLVGDRAQESQPLTFVLEKDGRSVTLQASLIWLELSGESAEGRRLELIVDTGGEPGWRELQNADTVE